MKSYLLILLSFLFLQTGSAQIYQTGDLLFQDLECGDMCSAIEMVTQGYEGQTFSHIGLVYRKNDSVYVIEAIGTNVHLTPINDFLARTPKLAVQGRLKPAYQQLIPAAIGYSLRQLGVPYDDEFLYNNGKYYCSELIYDAFKSANNDTPFFELQPMTFRKPGSGQFFTVWVDYYAGLNMDIPEGKPGINPGGISRSDKIEILK